MLRIVVRNGFTRDLAGMLLADLAHVVDRLEGKGSAVDQKSRTGFHH